MGTYNDATMTKHSFHGALVAVTHSVRFTKLATYGYFVTFIGDFW